LEEIQPEFGSDAIPDHRQWNGQVGVWRRKMENQFNEGPDPNAAVS
jgi:hypothetical protein